MARLGGCACVSRESRWGQVADDINVSAGLVTRCDLVYNLYLEYLLTYEEEQLGDSWTGPGGCTAAGHATGEHEEEAAHGEAIPMTGVKRGCSLALGGLFRSGGRVSVIIICTSDLHNQFSAAPLRGL